jgi:predicted dehydrogenase
MALGWGLIGPGLHADRCILPAICQSSSSKLIGICHYNKEKADFFAKRYNAKRSYTTLEEMLADPEIQVVDVATPETMHKEQVIKAAQAGKHVRCEFPLSVTIEESEEMLAACQKAKVKLATGFAWAQHPAHIEMKKRVANGSLGVINFVEGQYNFPYGGGLVGGQTNWKIQPRTDIAHNQTWKRDPSYVRSNAVFHQGIVIHILRYILGREVEEVTAFTDATGENKSIACLKFEGDIFGFALGSHMFPYGSRSLTVYGTDGRMTGVDTLAWGSTGELQVLKLRSDEVYKDMKKVGAKAVTTAGGLYFEGERSVENIEYCGANMWVGTIEAFNKSIVEDSEVIPSGIDGLRERQITMAILESSATGRAVKVPKL